jgi:hypothetical protein
VHHAAGHCLTAHRARLVVQGREGVWAPASSQQ